MCVCVRMLCNANFGSKGSHFNYLGGGGGVREATDRKISVSEECRIVRRIGRVEEGTLV